MKKVAIVFAAGSGTRMNSNSLPKQFLLVNGTPLIVYTLRWFQEHEQIDDVVLVCAPNWVGYAQELVRKNSMGKVRVICGGSSAMDSQYKGLVAVKAMYENAIVLMHDGVRPLISKELISTCIESVEKYGTAITVAKANETILNIDDSEDIKEVFHRSQCRIGRAPQCFFLSKLLSLHESYRQAPAEGIVDSASLARHFGEKLHTVEGPEENMKLTTPSDYYYFKAIIDARESLQFADI